VTGQQQERAFGFITLVSPIVAETPMIFARVLQEALGTGTSEIVVLVNCSGGLVESALTLSFLVKHYGHFVPISMVNIGAVASAAILVYASVPRNTRFCIGPHVHFGFHAFSGDAHVKQAQLLEDQYVQMIAANTQLSGESIKELMVTGRILSAEDAESAGLSVGVLPGELPYSLLCRTWTI
jgi:ATP-dependent protease ClpP protease subunit